jgi:hypothetical protein
MEMSSRGSARDLSFTHHMEREYLGLGHFGGATDVAREAPQAGIGRRKPLPAISALGVIRGL